MTDDVDEPETTGWDAIDTVLERVYGDVEPHQWGNAAETPGAKDPLHAVSAFRSDKGQPHWHFVTYGFSELWAKESDDTALSGFGFELTFRLARKPQTVKRSKQSKGGQAPAEQTTVHTDEPPEWVDDFLRNLARYVFKTGNVFGPGDSMPLNGPILAGVDTAIRAVAFLPDPELRTIDTPNGRVEFLQLVGLTDAEMEAIHCWDTLKFLLLMQGSAPVLVTDLARKSMLSDAQFVQTVEQRTRAEGSSSDASYCEEARFELTRQELTLILTAPVAGDVARRVAGRTLFGRPFNLYAPKCTLRFESAQQLRWERVRDGVILRLTRDQAKALITLLNAGPGKHQSPQLPGVKIVIENGA